ncbi:GDSL-type esterase/lipase family protein [Spongisporangium articulatum]|uniref:GDSL-type esterase/lipase family protein n=1 Tax=Spongisporangium articulatum TaxID=3362603 RepID=A0ABW8AN88_9ACTN
MPWWSKVVTGGVTGLVLWGACQLVPWDAGRVYDSRVGMDGDVQLASGDRMTVVGLGDSLLVRPDSWFRRVCATGDVGSCENAGVRGDTTSGMYTRLGVDVLERKPSAMVLMGGTNDLRDDTPADVIVGQLDEIVRGAEDHGIRVVLCTVPPRDEYREQALALNDAIRSYAAGHDLKLLDLYSVVGTSEGLYGPGLSDDGIHPNAVGSERMAKLADVELPSLLG